MKPLRTSSDPTQLSDPDRARIQAASDRYSDSAADDVPESTMLVELLIAKCAVQSAINSLSMLHSAGDLQSSTPARNLAVRLIDAREAIRKALDHYDHDKLSDIGAHCE